MKLSYSIPSDHDTLLLLLSLVLLIIPPLLDVGFYFWTLAFFSYYCFCACCFFVSLPTLERGGQSVAAGNSIQRGGASAGDSVLFRCRLVSVLCLGSPLGVLVMG